MAPALHTHFKIQKAMLSGKLYSFIRLLIFVHHYNQAGASLPRTPYPFENPKAMLSGKLYSFIRLLIFVHHYNQVGAWLPHSIPILEVYTT